MADFDQKSFDELMGALKELRKKHEEEVAAIQKEITKVLFPDASSQ